MSHISVGSLKAFEPFSKVKVLGLAQTLFLEKYAPALQTYPHPTEETGWNAQVQHSKFQKRPQIPSHYIAGSVHWVMPNRTSYMCKNTGSLSVSEGFAANFAQHWVTVWSLQFLWCFPRRLQVLSIDSPEHLQFCEADHGSAQHRCSCWPHEHGLSYSRRASLGLKRWRRGEPPPQPPIFKLLWQDPSSRAYSARSTLSRRAKHTTSVSSTVEKNIP